jgi:hypothetical protein
MFSKIILPFSIILLAIGAPVYGGQNQPVETWPVFENTPSISPPADQNYNCDNFFTVPASSELQSVKAEIDLTLVGTCLWNQMTHVTIDSIYAYCVMPYGIIILDISDPAAPVYVSRCFVPGAFDVIIDGDLAFVSCGDNALSSPTYTGMTILDISDPYNPLPVSFYDTYYRLKSIAVSDKYAFLAIELIGLQIVDISDPLSPVLVGGCTTNHHPQHLKVKGNFAYIADYLYLTTIDVSDVSNPFIADTIMSTETNIARRLDLVGDYVYLAQDFQGMTVYNISDPYNVTYAGRYNAYESVLDVRVINSTAYITLRDTTMMVVDVSTPSSPSLLGWHDSNMPYPTWPGIDVSGNYAFVADSSLLRIIDVSNPSEPEFISYYNVYGPPLDVEVSGDNAYVANRSGVKILDISGPGDPVEIGYHWTLDKCLDVDIQDTILCAADAFNGYHFLNVADPANPVEFLHYDTPGFVFCATFDENYIYIGDGDSMIVYDITDVTTPVQIASMYMPGTTRDIEVSGQYAYVADYEAGVHIFDVSDPDECARVTDFFAGGYPLGLDVVGDYLYVVVSIVYGVRDLQIFDVSDPYNPDLLSIMRFGNTPYAIEVIGDYAYIAGMWAGAYVVNISNPTSPTLAGSYETPGIAYELAVTADHIYLADKFGLMSLAYESGTMCGDADGSGDTNVGDAVFLINYIFKGGPAPPLICAADANGDNDVNVGDVVFLIEYIFGGGPPPLECCQ